MFQLQANTSNSGLDNPASAEIIFTDNISQNFVFNLTFQDTLEELFFSKENYSRFINNITDTTEQLKLLNLNIQKYKSSNASQQENNSQWKVKLNLEKTTGIKEITLNYNNLDKSMSLDIISNTDAKNIIKQQVQELIDGLAKNNIHLSQIVFQQDEEKRKREKYQRHKHIKQYAS